MGRIHRRTFELAAAIARRCSRPASAHAAKQGLILADTKYEMGLDRRARSS